MRPRRVGIKAPAEPVGTPPLAAFRSEGACRAGLDWVYSIHTYPRGPTMKQATCVYAFAPLIASCLLGSAHPARTLTVDQRIQAQEAIERVYYAHQIGADEPFERVVTRELIEKKVRTYLKQTMALETVWSTPVTAEMLRAEQRRIARSTRLPDRLRELHAALGDDPFLIMECLVRPVLVDRLARSFLSADQRFQGEKQEDAPEKATQTTPKMSWDDWWSTESAGFDEDDVRPVAEPSSVEAPVLSSPASLEDDCVRWKVDVGYGPVARTGHVSVWTGSLMLVWGGDGTEGGDRYDPATDTWSRMSPAGSPPLVFDGTAVWTGTEMIVWGGGYFVTPIIESTKAGGRYNPLTDSWTPTSELNAPAKRFLHTAIWTGSRMVVWGGRRTVIFSQFPFQSAPVSYSDGGEYDPATDTWLTFSGPSQRDSHTAVWTGTRMIGWGGVCAGGQVPCASEPVVGYSYDPASHSFTPISTADAPELRSRHTGIWTGSRMVVWGGRTFSSALQTGGQYDPVSDTWTMVSTTGAPTARSHHRAVWTGSRMIVWGGGANPPSTVEQTGGQYDPGADTWTTTSIVNAPSARSGHTAVWTGSRMIVWGGPANTGGRYDPGSDSWTPTLAPHVPPATLDNTAVWTGNLMIVFASSTSRYDPTLDVWTPGSQVNAPSPRKDHTAVWAGGRMIVWGGWTGACCTAFATGGRYDPISDTWLPTSTISSPTGRYNHTAVSTGSRMIIWGGRNGGGGGVFGDVGLYDPQINAWLTVSPTGTPPDGRSNHTAVWTGSEMIVWGGVNNGGVQNNGGRYDPAADSWIATPTAGAPSARADHTAIWSGIHMVIWGGSGGDNTGGRYDPASDSWLPVTTSGAPDGRFEHSAVWTGQRMIVWGGRAFVAPGYVFFNTGGTYDPDGDVWVSPTSTLSAPSPRSSHTAVWTGEGMVVWGPSRNGGIYYPFGSDGDGDAFCGLADCDDAQAAVYPGAPQVCDGLNNDCNSPTWPSLAQTNEADNDGDGLSTCQQDCNDADGTAYGAPGEVPLLVADQVAQQTVLTWTAPGELGGTSAGYDTLRASFAGDFVQNTTCVESADGSDTTSSDPQDPPLGGVYFYLVQVENACPHPIGLGVLGTSSEGVPRYGRTCP